MRLAEASAPKRSWIEPAVLFVAAAAVRVSMAWEAWNDVPFLKAPVVDGAEYWAKGREAAAGAWWPETMGIHPPLYGWFVGVVFRIFGEGTFWVFALQALLGAGTVVLLWKWTKAIAGATAARIAGALAALAWPLAYQEIQPSATGLVLFLLAAGLVLAEWAARGHPFRWLAAGACIGLAGITHGLSLAFSLVLFTPLLAKTRRAAAASALGLAAAAMPPMAVCAVNAGLDDGAYALQANVGLNVWIGNNPEATGFPNVVQGRDYDDLVDSAWRDGALTASEQNRWFLRRAAGWAVRHPLDWLALAGRKAVGTLGNAEVDSSMEAKVFRDRMASRWLAPVPWGVVAGLAVPGMYLLWKRTTQRPLVLAAALAAGVPLVLLLTSARYRVPLALVAIPAAAVAIEAVVVAVRARAVAGWRREWGLVAAGAGALALSFAVGPPPGVSFPEDRFLGSSLAELGRFSDAERHLRAARAQRPADPMPPLLLARLYLRAGLVPLAEQETVEALRVAPDFVDGLAQATALFFASGHPQDLEPLFQKAAQADPADSRIHGRWGEVRLQSGAPRAALAPLARAVELQPRSRTYRANYGSALLGSGDPAGAEEQFRAILEADEWHAGALYGLAEALEAQGRRGEALGFARRAADAGHPDAPAFVEKLLLLEPPAGPR